MAKPKTDARPVDDSLLSKDEVLKLLNDIAPSTLWEWMRTQQFPLPIELGSGKRSSTVAWWNSEVRNWLSNRPRRQIGRQQFPFRGRRDDKPPTAKMKAKRLAASAVR